MKRPDQPEKGIFKDESGRELTYLRVSLTERCNMKCIYCQTGNAPNDTPPQDLSDSELLELIGAFSILGVDKIRFTGGEPLLRRGIVDLVRNTRTIDNVTLVGLTTNGLLLDKLLDPLVQAGLNRLNVSLDTLNPERFKRITGVDCFPRVLGSIKDAVDSGVFARVKINTVVMRGFNDDEVHRFSEWGIQTGLDIRFIEFMPTRHSAWSEKLFVGEKELRENISLPLEPDPSTKHNDGPAKTFLVPGQPGRVSFISAVTSSFCDSCNRLRVTSSGEIVGCLFGVSRFDCRPYLGGKLDTGEIAEIIASHISRAGFRRTPSERSITDDRPSMRGIGG